MGSTSVSSSTTLDQFQWGYDRASNRKWKENLVASEDQDEHYNYDGLYQVEQFDRGNLNINRSAIGGIPSAEEDFQYDPTGNWKRYTFAEDGTVNLDQTRKHNKDNQLTQIDGSSGGITYDCAGNATLVPPDASGDWSKSYTLTWDAWNRLVKVADGAATIADYAYDGTFRRTTKTVGGTVRHYYYNDEWKIVEERVDASTNAERQYVWGNRYPDGLVLRDRDTDDNGTLNERLYVTHDYFNPTSILDISGNVQERYCFTPFGGRAIMAPDFLVRATSNFDWDFAFHGQFLDGEVDYYNFGFRTYTPDLGEWLNRDPIEEMGRSNLYGFVSNNPVNLNDLLGLSESDGLIDKLLKQGKELGTKAQAELLASFEPTKRLVRNTAASLIEKYAAKIIPPAPDKIKYGAQARFKEKLGVKKAAEFEFNFGGRVEYTVKPKKCCYGVSFQAWGGLDIKLPSVKSWYTLGGFPVFNLTGALYVSGEVCLSMGKYKVKDYASISVGSKGSISGGLRWETPDSKGWQWLQKTLTSHSAKAFAEIGAYGSYNINFIKPDVEVGGGFYARAVVDVTHYKGRIERLTRHEGKLVWGSGELLQ